MSSSSSLAALPKETFWAATKNSKELVRYLVTIRKGFQDLQRTSGAVDAAWRNLQLYLGIDKETGRSGEIYYDRKNEMPRIFVNHLRANTRIILQYTTGQPPTWDCQAKSDSPQALEACKVGNQQIDHNWETSRLDRIAPNVAELALVMRSAFLLAEYDETAGKAIGVIDVKRRLLRYEGDLHFAALTPWQVVFDPAVPSPADWRWVLWGELKPRWDLASIHFDKRDEIIRCRPDRGNDFYGMEYGIISGPVPEDFIWQWTFVHLPGKAEGLKKGRMLRFIGDETPLLDGPCPEYYALGSDRRGRLPVHRLVHSETPGSTISGHTPVDDGAPLQQALNAQITTILANHAKFGRAKMKGRLGDCINIMSLPEDDVLQVEDVNGLDFMKPPGNADLMAMADQYIAQMGAVMGVAEASRGIAPSNETAALSLALQDSSTVTNNRGFDLNYRSLLQDIANGIIEILQVVADRPRQIAVVGEGNRGSLVRFSKETLQPISRVTVTPASPMLRLNSGRVGFLEAIIAKFPNLIHNEAEILTALETGNFSGVFKGFDRQLAQAKDENERIRLGEGFGAEQHEHHVLHIKTHAEELGGPVGDADTFEYHGRLKAHVATHVQFLMDPGTQGLMVCLGYMRVDEVAALQSVIGMIAGMAGGMGGPPGGPPAAASSQGGQPAEVAQPGGNLAPAEQTMAAGRDFLENRAGASPMNLEASNP